MVKWSGEHTYIADSVYILPAVLIQFSKAQRSLNKLMFPNTALVLYAQKEYC